MNIQEWLLELRKVARESYPDIDEWYTFDVEAWRDYYESDYTPEDAFDEEQTYWDGE